MPSDPHSRVRLHRLAMVADSQHAPPYREADISTAEACQNTAPWTPDLAPRTPRCRGFREMPAASRLVVAAGGALTGAVGMEDAPAIRALGVGLVIFAEL